MKCISFLVPCYNSEPYLARCVDSLLLAGEDAEIIIVNDGSRDRTLEIAEAYRVRHPDVIRVVDQENGGHGSAVNRGIERAEGLYFKVVDSDDWLDPEALQALMLRLRGFCAAPPESDVPDLILCNYVYDHLNEHRTHSIHYRQVMDPDRQYGWDDLHRFGFSQYFVMHAMIYRTQVLRQCGLVLPEHIFYEDNIFSYQPLPYVRHLYYIDIDLYHYFIGRADQSVNESVMLRNIDQQVRITYLTSRCVDFEKVRRTCPRLADYMRRYLSMLYSITDVLLFMKNTDKSRQQYRTLWADLREQDPELYRLLRHRSMSMWTVLPGRACRRGVILSYRAARRLYQFN